jgi:prepilin signal peptidase PulO-like enzyme (type II secretory pathway)
MITEFSVLFYCAVAVLGLIVGSFLNVVIARYGTGMTVGGRSKCFSCGKQLSWYELIPLFSFLAQGGKCRGCKSGISWQYPIIEALTALIFLLVATISAADPLITTFDGWFALTILCLSLVMAAYDVRHKVVPDGMVYSTAVIALIYTITRNLIFTPYSQSFQELGWDVAAGFIVAIPFYLLWKISRGTWIGLGDAKIALVIGWFLGLHGAVSAIIFSFWIGALYAIIALLWDRGLRTLRGGHHRSSINIKTEVPFAPFLLLGMIIVYATGAAPADIVAAIMFSASR